MRFGTSCAISGTGFCISREIIEKNNGWKYHLLTEDIEFSVDMAIQGETIGYSGGSVVYDEQPVTFEQSWNQRLRWSKGFYQVFGKYGGSLFKRIFSGSFACSEPYHTETLLNTPRRKQYIFIWSLPERRIKYFQQSIVRYLSREQSDTQ
jgi:cellulose synthase/poly-beta-1,6-N-acetylglucosamine synthase-like glycosyltransferase